MHDRRTGGPKKVNKDPGERVAGPDCAARLRHGDGQSEQQQTGLRARRKEKLTAWKRTDYAGPEAFGGGKSDAEAVSVNTAALVSNRGKRLHCTRREREASVV
jgi:hypothetical protein